MKFSLFHFLILTSILAIVFLAEEPKQYIQKKLDMVMILKTTPQSKTNNKPTYFSIKVEDGNYKVTFIIGSDEYEGDTTIRAESRRLLVHNLSTKKGEFKTFTFVVHKRSPKISDGTKVRLKERELNYIGQQFNH